MRDHTSTHTADRVRDDVAGAACRWQAGDPWLGVHGATREATAAMVRLIVPHGEGPRGGALAVPLFDRLPAVDAGPIDLAWGDLAGHMNLACFGVAARLGPDGDLLLFRAAPSTARRADGATIPWTGGVAVTLQIARDLREAVARAVHVTPWPPWTAPRLAFRRDGGPR